MHSGCAPFSPGIDGVDDPPQTHLEPIRSAAL
jgi:hypothetical protein